MQIFKFIHNRNTAIKIAHRGGLALYPENTLEAFYSSVTYHNIKMLEMDLQITKDDKVIVFKMKRRKGYQVKNGHRQNFTLVKIAKFKKATAKKATTKKAEPEKTSATTKKATAKKTANTKKDK